MRVRGARYMRRSAAENALLSGSVRSSTPAALTPHSLAALDAQYHLQLALRFAVRRWAANVHAAARQRRMQHLAARQAAASVQRGFWRLMARECRLGTFRRTAPAGRHSEQRTIRRRMEWRRLRRCLRESALHARWREKLRNDMVQQATVFQRRIDLLKNDVRLTAAREAWHAWAEHRRAHQLQRIQRDVEASWLGPRGDCALLRRGMRRLQFTCAHQRHVKSAVARAVEFAARCGETRLCTAWTRFCDALQSQRLVTTIARAFEASASLRQLRHGLRRISERCASEARFAKACDCAALFTADRRRQYLAVAWPQFHGYLQDRWRAIELSDRHALMVLQRRGRATLQRWYAHAHSGLIAQRLSHLPMQRVLHRWRNASSRSARRMLPRASSHLLHRSLARGWKGWCSTWAGLVHDKAEQLSRAASHCASRHRKRGWTAWRQVWIDAVRTHACFRRRAMHLLKRWHAETSVRLALQYSSHLQAGIKQRGCEALRAWQVEASIRTRLQPPSPLLGMVQRVTRDALHSWSTEAHSRLHLQQSSLLPSVVHRLQLVTMRRWHHEVSTRLRLQPLAKPQHLHRAMSQWYKFMCAHLRLHYLSSSRVESRRHVMRRWHAEACTRRRLQRLMSEQISRTPRWRPETPTPEEARELLHVALPRWHTNAFRRVERAVNQQEMIHRAVAHRAQRAEAVLTQQLHLSAGSTAELSAMLPQGWASPQWPQWSPAPLATPTGHQPAVQPQKLVPQSAPHFHMSAVPLPAPVAAFVQTPVTRPDRASPPHQALPQTTPPMLNAMPLPLVHHHHHHQQQRAIIGPDSTRMQRMNPPLLSTSCCGAAAFSGNGSSEGSMFESSSDAIRRVALALQRGE